MILYLEKFLEREYQKEQESNIKNASKGHSSVFEVLKPEDEILLQSLTLDSLNYAIKEVKYILQTVSTLIASLDLTAEESEEFGVLISSSNVNSFEPQTIPKQRSTSSLSNSVRYSSSLCEQVSSDVKPALRRSASFTTTSHQCDTVSNEEETGVYEPKLVRTTNKRRYDKSLKDIFKLCSKSAYLGLKRLQYVQKYFSKDLATLLLEKREGEVLQPNQGLLTLGRCVYMNYLPNE